MDIRDQTLILVEIQDQILFTRPDIIFAEHQVARFTNAPMKRYTTDFKMIIRYIWREHTIKASLFHPSLVVYFSDAMWIQILLIYFRLIVKKTQLQPSHIPVSSLP